MSTRRINLLSNEIFSRRVRKKLTKRVGYFLHSESESPLGLGDLKGTPPVILLGMHRSGTTLVSKLLRKAGVNMAYFRGLDTDESIFFQGINKAVFSIAHCDWDIPQVMTDALANESFLNAITKSVYELMMNKSLNRTYFGGKDRRNNAFSTMSSLWGWKDPRTCLTLPIWLNIFPEAQIIFLKRNGIDVANSLVTRNKTRYGKSNYTVHLSSLKGAFRLWEDYNRICLNELNKLNSKQYITVGYEDLLDAPESQLNQIFDFIKSDGQLKLSEEELSAINSKRAFAFTNSPESRVFYETVKNTHLMKSFGYDDIL